MMTYGFESVIPAAILITLLSQVGMTEAADGNANVVAVIGISLGTSLVTTLVTLAIAFAIHRHFTSSKNAKSFTRTASRNNARQSFQSQSSTKPLTTQQSYTAVPISTIDIQEETSLYKPQTDQRRKCINDYISKWCTENNLTEQTATSLRNAGFIYEETINSLTVEDIPKLNIPNTAQECLLRNIVKKRRSFNSASSQNTTRSRIRSKSVSSDRLSPTETHNSSSGSSKFERMVSTDDVDGHQIENFGRSLKSVPKPSMSSLEILNDAAIIIRGPNTDVHLVSSQHALNHDPRRNRQNPKNFQGLLSDRGLYDLANMLGEEWFRLAAMLEIPSNILDQIRMDNPTSTKQQIFKMLEMWRDTSRGNKEQIKGALHKALIKVERRDLAEDLLLEQVEGSSEKVSYQSVI